MTIASMEISGWLMATQAAKALGVGVHTLPKVAPKLGIRVRNIPGSVAPPRYNEADVKAAVARLEKEEADRLRDAQSEINETARPRNR